MRSAIVCAFALGREPVGRRDGLVLHHDDHAERGRDHEREQRGRDHHLDERVPALGTPARAASEPDARSTDTTTVIGPANGVVDAPVTSTA